MSHDSFSRVRALTPVPSFDARNTSGGVVRLDLENTMKPGPGWTAEIAPPSSTRVGLPPEAGTVKRLSRPLSPAVNQIVLPSFDSV